MLKPSWHSLVAIATLGSYTLANPLGYREVLGNASLNTEHLFGRDTTDEFDPADLSFITKMAAIGDSYSAGIGAGGRLGSYGDWACSRYDNAYPYLIHTDERLGDQAARTFQFESCSGAVTSDVLEKQIPALNADQQVILLSAGGNDVELSNILNHCIFRWASFTPDEVDVARLAANETTFFWKDSFNWENLALGCAGQLARTQEMIADDAFGKSLDTVITAAKLKLASDGMIYYTGYAKFFAEDLTSACDDVSWSIWTRDSGKLTTDHRKVMNELVDDVNAQIAAAVERAGSQVKFVNYDSYVGHFNGRFCEDGVDESTVESTTRTGLMFYELNTFDLGGSNPWKRSVDEVEDGTFEGSVNELAQITLWLDPNAKLSDQSMISDETVASIKSLAVSKVAPSATDSEKREIPNLLPDGYGRVFHPQPLLHQIIASLVIYEMANKNEQDNGLPEIPEKFSYNSCSYSGSSGSNDSNAPNRQQIAVASYINPLGDPASWERIFAYDTQKLSILVANVLNGPDYVVDEAWKSVIDQAASQGKKILGYVRTGYLGVSQQQFTTRLGSKDLADWASQIEQDVDKWFELYGTSLGGIFFDEGWPECGPNNIYADLYAYINKYTKNKYPGAFTVLNPGSPIAQCFENTMDTLLTFESSYETYISSYVPNDWTPKDPRKLWHIIYKVPQDQVATVAALASSRHAGLLEITDDDQPNPYDNLPSEAYMQALIGAVPGGTPLIGNPAKATSSHVAGLPSDVAISSSDYSSVTLTWSSVSNALGYAVYKDGALVLELPASLTRATVGMLDPGSSGISFEVRTVLTSGSGGGSSRTISASTKSLPSDGPITNVSYTQNGDTVVYKADVLVPYAFVRLFIGINQDDQYSFNPTPVHGWPMDKPGLDSLGTQLHQIVNYLVEGNAFYSGFYEYTGTWNSKSKSNAEWSWSSIGVAPQSQSGYTYTWNVPLAGTDAVASEYLIQGQGYAPINNLCMGTLFMWSVL
ncbi:CAZyme family GH135 [Penicillium roqueforti]|nr:CAZyme family GH135 [Penicillium roqueforti]KAI3120805.1 CAZyme family GH135 [Penicillium roqueforti]